MIRLFIPVSLCYNADTVVSKASKYDQARM